MPTRSSLTVVLAAGEGTRMCSTLPKVLHLVAGQSLLAHVLQAAPSGATTSLAVVIGPEHAAVADEARRVRSDAQTFVQRKQLGTAHAVLAAREAMAKGVDDLLIAFGDTPLISAETFARLRAPLSIVRAVWQARAVLKRVRPRVVLGAGGYVSGPGGIAAWLLGIPLVIHEQNAVAGLTNRWLARIATEVLEAFPGAQIESVRELAVARRPTLEDPAEERSEGDEP